MRFLTKHLISYLILSVLFVCSLALSASAQPKFTTKENAIELALLLDKGSYGKLVISSTYVLNTSTQDYYISAILSDGTSHKWFINQIYDWVKSEQVKLAGNRSLVFLNPKSSKFEILEKNRFHKIALRSKVYVKEYPIEDPLEGQRFYYRIKSFNLISLKQRAFGKDPNGFYYRYVIDLVNGSQELLTYNDAYRAMQTNSLLPSEPEGMPILNKAYHITQIIPHQKSGGENGISQFGLEVIFDRPIQLTGNNFPLEIYEKTILNRKTKRNFQSFVIDLTIPNAEKKFELKPISHLEYLKDIEIVKDFRYQKRLLLRAKFNPDVSDIPPIVTKVGDRGIFMTFFHLVDQTVFNRSMLMEEEQRKSREQTSQNAYKVSTKINRQTEYGKAFIRAVDSLSQAKRIKEVEPRIEMFLEAILNFEQAGIESQSDKQLMEALNLRNSTREEVVQLSLGYVRDNINNKSVLTNRLLTHLENVERQTIDSKILAEVEELRKKIEER